MNARRQSCAPPPPRRGAVRGARAKGVISPAVQQLPWRLMDSFCRRRLAGRQSYHFEKFVSPRIRIDENIVAV